jgi:hypothetical protein
MDRGNIVTLVVVFISAFLLGRCTVEPDNKVVEVVRYKRVPVENPRPVKTSTTIKTVRIPTLLFAPGDTTTIVKTVVDSVEMQVPFERNEYRDSSLYAIVSGPALGGLHPRLEYYETYNKESTTTISTKKFLLTPYVSGMVGIKGRYVGVGGGVFVNGHHGFGIDYIHNQHGEYVGGRYTYKF